MKHGFASDRAERLDGLQVKLAPDDIHCWLFSLDAACSDQSLDGEERAHAARLRFDRDRRRFVAGRDGVRRILSRYVKALPDNLKIAAEEGGRPFLKGGDINFNFSRSETWGLLAVSDASVLGVDMEAVRKSDDLADTARQFFTTAEQDSLNTLSGAAWVAGFFNCWTRKEAVVKARGTGLTAPLDAFDVTLGPDEPAKILRAEGDLAIARDWTMRAFNPVDGYSAAVVTDLSAPNLHFLRVIQR